MLRNNWVSRWANNRQLSRSGDNLPSRAAMTKALRSKLDHIDQHIREVRARRRQIVKLLKKEIGD